MPSNADAVWKIVGQILTGLLVVVAFVMPVLKRIFDKWLDSRFATRLEKVKHDQQRELEHVKHEIQSMFSRIVKVHEKEYEVLPKAWFLLQVSLGSATKLIATLKMVPALTFMPEAQLVLKLRS